MKIAQQGRTWRAIARLRLRPRPTVGVAVACRRWRFLAATGAAPVLGSARPGRRRRLPWGRVEAPAWSLAMYSARQGGEGIKPKAGPSTLYLVDPAGGRYRLLTWAARSPRTSWYLQAWSGDMRRAMFVPEGQVYNPGVRQHVYQLQLRTGKISGLTLPPRVSGAMGRVPCPDGLNILAQKSTPTGPDSNAITLQRYSLTGKLQATLARVPNFEGSAYQPARLLRGWRSACRMVLELVSNAARGDPAAARPAHQVRLQPRCAGGLRG